MENPDQNVVKNPDQVIMTFDEFLTDAQTSDLFQQVADEIAQEQKESVVVESGVRTEEEWAVLMHQVVASGSDAQPKTDAGQNPGVREQD